MKRKKINKLLNDRNRLIKRARMEYIEAQNLFSVGSLDFADSLQLANQHYGAAQAITYTLKSFGYEEKRKMTARQKRALKEWAKQKISALSIILLAIISLMANIAIIPFCALVCCGVFLLFTKKKWFKFIMGEKQR